MRRHKPFGAKLKALRKAAKLRIEQVAADTRISVRQLRAYEQGENAPKDDAKLILCEYYGADIGEIFFAG